MSWNMVDGGTSGEIKDGNTHTQKLNLSREAKFIRFKRTANAEKGIFGIWKNIGKVAFNVSAINVVMADSFMVDKTALDFPRTPINTESAALNIAVRFQNAGTEMSVSSNSDEFVASIKDGSNMDCLGTKTLQVVFKPTIIGDKEATITVATNAGYTQTIVVRGSASNTVEPEHTFTGRTLYQVDETINLAEVWTSTSPAARSYSVVRFVPANAEDGGAEPTIAADNTLSLTQAGTLDLQLAQEATGGFYECKTTRTITIDKYGLTATISQSAATWDATIDNPFAISYDLNDFTVEALDPTIATYIGGSIQTYAETGTARFVISRPEDYKYNQLAETLSISVAPKTDICYVLEQIGEVDINTYSGAIKYDLSGIGETLSVLVRRQSGGTQGFTIKGYDANGNATTLLNLSNSDIPTSYGSPFTASVPASIVRIEVTSGGTLNKYFKELRITRANYLTPSAAEVSMSSTIDTDAQATVDIAFGSCGATLKVVSNNPKITVSPTSFYAEGSGTQEIILTGDATALGTETATITIYDQSKKTTVNVTSTITRIPQTISWQSSFENLDVFSTVALDATASGETEVGYSIADGDQGKASIEGNVLSFHEAGTVRVVASAAQSEIYEGVSDTVSVVVHLAQPVVSVLPIVEAIAYGTALTDEMLLGGVAMYGESTVEGSFAWADEQITDGLTPNTYSFNVRFTPADATHYSTIDSTVEVTVEKAQQAIVWQSSFADLNVLSEVSLSATAQTAVRFEVSDSEVATITGDLLTFLKAGVVDVVAIAAESDLYQQATDTIKGVVIAKIDPVVSQWPAATLTYGETLAGVVLAGESAYKGAFQWGDTITTAHLDAVKTAGLYTYQVKFVPDNGEQFNTVYGEATITIEEASQTISWENAPTSCKVGDRIALEAVASSGLAVDYYVDQIDNYAMIDTERNELVALAKGAIQLRVSQAGEVGKYQAAEEWVQTINIEAGNTTATEQVGATEQVSVRKVMRDGVLYILRDGQCYDTCGRLVGAE